MGHDPHKAFKDAQRKSWALFAPLEHLTTLSAARLVTFAGVGAGQRILDVGCGTGVVALTTVQKGACALGIDLCGVLVERAQENTRIAGMEAHFLEGDAEDLPFEDASFDAVLSQFGHMFAPRPPMAVNEMLRVLKPGGTLAFSTWPLDAFVGQLFELVRAFSPLPEGVSPPSLWGDKQFIAAQLGARISHLTFEEGVMAFPALSLGHYRACAEATLGPLKRFVEDPTTTPKHLRAFHASLDALTARYFAHNHVHQVYLMTRAVKVSS